MSSVNYITHTHSASISAYKGEELSITTKMRLEALGIDPSSVTTEAQAQILIAQAEAAQSQNNSGKQGGKSSQQQLISEAKNLAQKVGAQALDNDSLDSILNKISEAIQTLANNPANGNKVKEYQSELKDIAQRANIVVNIQENIFNKMNMISLSNKLILGLY